MMPAPDLAELRVALRALLGRIDQFEQGHGVVIGTPPSHEPGPLRVATIVNMVGYEMGLNPAAICGERKEKPQVRARAAVVWLTRQLTGRSYPSIGMVLGGRDHTTIMHAEKKAVALRASDPAFLRLTNRLLTHFRDLQED